MEKNTLGSSLPIQQEVHTDITQSTLEGPHSTSFDDGGLEKMLNDYVDNDDLILSGDTKKNEDFYDLSEEFSELDYLLANFVDLW